MEGYALYGLAFISSFVFIALKSAQQLHVVFKHYYLILPTSMLMAICEVYVISTTAHNGWGWIVLPIGLGGGLGSLFSTWMHHNFLHRK